MDVMQVTGNQTKIFEYSLFALIIYQIVHFTDHILQYLQYKVLSLSFAPGLFEGILNASDTIIHLWLNVLEFGLIVIIWLAFRNLQLNWYRIQFGTKNSANLKIILLSIFFLLAFQAIHVSDHILQYVQKFIFKIEGPPAIFQGISGESDAVTHLYINGVLLGAILIIWLKYRQQQILYSAVTSINFKQ